MSAITALSPGIPSANQQMVAGSALPATPGAAVPDVGTRASPSTLVTLSASAPTSKWTYSLPGFDHVQPAALLWDNDSDDPVNAAMALAISANGATGRYPALGAALLDRFKTSGENFAQAVSIDSAQLGIAPTTALASLSSQIGLTVETASGIKVELSLTQHNGALAVQVTSDGQLSDDERVALATLADAFQLAIDGLTADKPRIALDGLMQFDPAVLSAVELTATTPTAKGEVQTLSFHADSKQRTLDLRLPSGTISLSTDLSNPVLWGNEAKRGKAIAGFLQRFDAAERRGHGDANLAGLFKDAFVQLNGGYAPPPADSATRAALLSGDALNDEEHALLTGLADFQASLVQTIATPNPKKSKQSTEIDSFSYQIAQHTTISDVRSRNMRERAITQTQSSTLRASYHEPPKPGAPLFPPPIDGQPDPDEQSYYYYRIADQANSTATIVRHWLAERPHETGQIGDPYTKDVILKAELRQEASQSTHMTHFDRDKLVEDIITPESKSRILDLLSTLARSQSHLPRTQDEQTQRQEILATISKHVLLLDDPANT